MTKFGSVGTRLWVVSRTCVVWCIQELLKRRICFLPWSSDTVFDSVNDLSVDVTTRSAPPSFYLVVVYQLTKN